MRDLRSLGRGHGRHSVIDLAGAVAAVALLVSPIAVAPAIAGTTGGTPQAITFNPPYDAVVGESLGLNATAASGLPVNYALEATSSGCTLDTATLTFSATGACVVTASQPGNASWDPAPSLTRTIALRLGYTADWSISTPDHSTRAAGTIQVGDRLTVTLAASDGSTAVTSCELRITSVGGRLMQSHGALTDGECSLSFVLPAFSDPAARTFGDRRNTDVCVSVQALGFSDDQARAMVASDRTQPGGLVCNDTYDGTARQSGVLDFQVIDGGVPQPFASDPPMISWNPADWTDYTPIGTGTTAHLEPPASVPNCYLTLVGSAVASLSPSAPAGCEPWDVRLPGVLPANVPWPGAAKDWQVELQAVYATDAGFGWTIADVERAVRAVGWGLRVEPAGGISDGRGQVSLRHRRRPMDSDFPGQRRNSLRLRSDGLHQRHARRLRGHGDRPRR